MWSDNWQRQKWLDSCGNTWGRTLPPAALPIDVFNRLRLLSLVFPQIIRARYTRSAQDTMNTLLHAQLLVLAVCCLGYVCSSPAQLGGPESRNAVANEPDGDLLLNASEDADVGENLGDMDKRAERYAFGLGRRSYMYTNGGAGMKRLPVYNFGLGKRARPYSFGLGKRSDFDYDQDQNEIDYRALPLGFMAGECDGDGGSDWDCQTICLFLFPSLSGGRGAPYKRTTRPQPFNFGLGRR